MKMREKGERKGIWQVSLFVLRTDLRYKISIFDNKIQFDINNKHAYLVEAIQLQDIIII